MKWTRGRETVDGLLAEGRLEPVTGAEADGSEWLVSAQALLESAKREHDANPEAAYVLAYDAARKASTALLAQQGLRTKTAAHHVTVEQVVRPVRRLFRWVRRPAPAAIRDRVPEASRRHHRSRRSGRRSLRGWTDHRRSPTATAPAGLVPLNPAAVGLTARLGMLAGDRNGLVEIRSFGRCADVLLLPAVTSKSA